MYIDVVIPVYNGESYIAYSIQSVLDQTLKPNRLIIVNDGSEDDTCNVIKKITDQYEGPILITLINQENCGLSAARNAGIIASNSKYISFLDADDVWISNKLELQISIFESSKEIDLGLVYCQYLLIGDRGRLINGYVAKPDHRVRGHVYNRLLLGNYIISSGSGVLIKKECFDLVGLFDVKLKAAEDWDMWLRISERYKVDFVPNVDLVQIRIHNNNMQKNLMHMFRNELIFFNKWAKILHLKNVRTPLAWASSIAFRVIRSDNVPRYYSETKSVLAEFSKTIFWLTFGSFRLYLILILVKVYVVDLLKLSYGSIKKILIVLKI
jgi:glycosyltransferase involved in cell wall biosynthesis